MVSINADPTFPGTVLVHRPGKSEPEKMVMTFRHKNEDDLADFLARASTDMLAVDAVMEIVAGWSDVDAPFTRESVATFLKERHGVGARIVNAYVDELRGARLGN